MSFSSIIRALSELWPFLAVGYLLVVASAGFFNVRDGHDLHDRL